MTTSQDDFSPTSIDQSIDHPGELLSHDDAQLIHDVRAMFEQEKQASIERGWARIASQRAQNASSDQPSEVLDLSLYRRRNERISLVQDTTLLSSPKKDTPKKRSRLRLLGLVAAVLVCVALVGSLTLVLGATRNHNTNVGSYNTALQPTPTATPNITPATCKDALDPAEQNLCAAGQETTLNLPLTIGSQNITFVRAYADQQRVIFIYSSTSPLNQSIIWHRLTTGQGWLQAAPSAVRHINTTLYELVFLPATPQAQVLTKPTLQVQSVQVIGPSVSPTPMTLQFTLPVHLGQRVVPLNQTQTSNGITLTLQSVTFTSCTTSLAIEINPSLDHFETASPLSFTLNGQSFTWPMYQENLGASSGTSTVNGMPGVPNTTSETILLDQGNALPAGSDTIQIQVGVSNTVSTTPSTAPPVNNHTWTFQVNIPAPTPA